MSRRVRPPAIAYTDCVDWTIRGILPLRCAIYMPKCARPSRVVVYFHGGAGSGGDMEDYPRDIFRIWNDNQYVILSAEYRLLPESSSKEQLQDVIDIEDFVRNSFGRDLPVDCAGHSWGGYLAGQTVHHWKQPPNGLILIQSPTDLNTLRPDEVAHDRVTTIEAQIASAIGRHAISHWQLDQPGSRKEMISGLWRSGLIVDIYVENYVWIENVLRFIPCKPDADTISKLALPYILRGCDKGLTVCLIVAAKDTQVIRTHALRLQTAMKQQGNRCEIFVMEGMDHADDIFEHKEIAAYQEAMNWYLGDQNCNDRVT